MPEKCVFAFLGDCVDEFAVKSNAKIAEEFENCCRVTNIYVTEYHNQEICLVRPNIGASAATPLLDRLQKQVGLDEKFMTKCKEKIFYE